jgi:hypothetical protein
MFHLNVGRPLAPPVLTPRRFAARPFSSSDVVQLARRAS